VIGDEARSARDRAAMRVTIVTDAWEPQVNGVVRTLKETVRELQRLGHSVSMVTPASFRTLPCPSYPEIRLSLATTGMVGRAIDATECDALHVATEGPLGWAARRYALRRRYAFTTAYHTRFPEYLRPRLGVPLDWSYAAMRHFHAPAARVMAPTPSIVSDLEARRFRNVVLWSRGVDLRMFNPEPAGPNPREFLKEERPIFLYVGCVAVEKNVEAFLSLDLPGTKWVVGEGPQLAELKARHGDSVHWAGVLAQHELARFYAAADVFVFPSRTDTFGLVLLEAMACGLPVAAYDVPGPRDVLAGSEAGAIGDDLRAACLRALDIPRSRARQHAALFSWEAAARQFSSHLVGLRG
jgi:glycosyltransferase involved in cell wall biosynthesis